MTDGEARAAKARAEAATSGPWDVERRDFDNVHDYPGDRSRVVISRDSLGSWGVQTGLIPSNDAAFIAHAREDVPALVDDLLEARGERDQLRAVMQQVVFSLERNDPGRSEGRMPQKADWEVALSMAKAALGHEAGRMR